MAIVPPPLKPGARVAVVSPAGPVDRESTQRGIDVLTRHGFVFDVLTHVFETSVYLAGGDRGRAEDVQRALTDDRFDAVICTRGGFGSMRLLPLLDFATIHDACRRKPRALIGFSDISALQWALWRECGLITFSGPQLARGFGGDDRGGGCGGVDEFTGRRLLAMLDGSAWRDPLPFPPDRDRLQASQGSHPVAGPLLGGNLAVLAALAGTRWTPVFDGAVVVLEEIDEPPYRIDRTLTQLALAGAFAGARGFVLGEFIQHVDGRPRDHTAIVAARVAELAPDATILTGAPYGHVGPLWTLPLGAHAALDPAAGTLTVEPAG
ncbi:MAG: putative murein peptide carboxypeptidase [Calditrichaeota bacterium]|nr:putative murein peptide carboxypeptidase [Calditrichota bacterium]